MRAVKVVGMLGLLVVMLALTGCFRQVQVPSGYVGKLLHPSGFDSKLLQPGQVNIGSASIVGKQSKLVILEATTITIQEQFRAREQSADGQDHRILTRDGVPVSVDMYVRIALPDDTDTLNSIFLLATPTPTDNPFISTISLQSIYYRFAEMDVRNRIRDIITRYANFQELLTNYTEINRLVALAAVDAFKASTIPLKLQDAQLSQVLPDPQVWDSEVKRKAAQAQIETIEQVGQAMISNPGYQEFLKWQSLEKIAASGDLIIITDAGSSTVPIVVNPK